MKTTINFGYALLAAYFIFIGAIFTADSRMELAAISAGFLVSVGAMFFYYNHKAGDK